MKVIHLNPKIHQFFIFGTSTNFIEDILNSSTLEDPNFPMYHDGLIKLSKEYVHSGSKAFRIINHNWKTRLTHYIKEKLI